MIWQKVLKGIAGLAQDDVRTMLDGEGIGCRWWRNVGLIGPGQIRDKLTEHNLLRHLNDYDEFGDDTPFISTTAGAVQRDPSRAVNVLVPALVTAVQFATDDFTAAGWVFYGYVPTLGHQAIELEHFAEEVRELNIYTQFLPYHDEGEIVAKVHIPAAHLECAEPWSVDRSGRATPGPRLWNPRYQPPEDHSNIRAVL